MAGVETFLCASQVAEMLGLSVATIRKWVLAGYIPYKKTGRAVRFSVSEIQDWAGNKCAGAARQGARRREGGGE
jgi:excisionase family DNA binding protein